MGKDDIARRIAQGELRSLAAKMFDQSNNQSRGDVCAHHQEQSRAIGCLLIGMDELLNSRKLNRGGLVTGLAVVGSVAAGVAFAIAKVIGFGVDGR